MAAVIQYRKTDGLIQGLWTSNTTALVEAQIVQDDPLKGYLVTDTTLDFPTLAGRHFVHEDMLLEKTALTLTADATPFAADGTTVCHVTVAPFVACMLLVDGIGVDLTEADPAVELTADVPHTFHVPLAPMAQYWATPLTAEAE